MKSLSILCVILGLSAAVSGATHDAKTKTSGRIVGGEPATVAQYPYMVSLRLTQQNEHFGGGFVYNTRWIITTATCVQNRTVQEFTAHIGTNSRTEPGLTQQIERIEIHPEYRGSSVMNNIALLRTAAVITQTGLVATLAIGTMDTPAGTEALIMGWGRTEVRGKGA